MIIVTWSDLRLYDHLFLIYILRRDQKNTMETYKKSKRPSIRHNNGIINAIVRSLIGSALWLPIYLINFTLSGGLQAI